MAEGVRPSSQREGSVLRTLLRRALTMLAIGDQVPLFVDLAAAVGQVIDQAPVVGEYWHNLAPMLDAEQTSFMRVLRTAKRDIDRLVSSAQQGDMLDPNTLFHLRTTKGVPFEYLHVLAAQHGFVWPTEELNRLLEHHSTTSKTRR